MAVETRVTSDEPPARSLRGFVVTKGPGSPDEPVGGPDHAGVKLGQACACGASFLVWLSFYDKGQAFACPSCGASMRHPSAERVA